MPGRIVWKNKPSFILSDMDGTIGPKSFLTTTLMPFVMRNASRTLLDEFRHRWVQDTIEMLGQDCENIYGRDAPLVPSYRGRNERDVIDGAVKCLEFIWDRRSKKPTPDSFLTLFYLVALKGYVWGDIKGEVYGDVTTALKAWQRLGIPFMVISSSHSETIQMNLASTNYGNVDSLVDGYYGQPLNKKKASTYDRVLDEVAKTTNNSRLSGRDAIFLTDDRMEGEAAKEAGWSVVLVRRDGARFDRSDERDYDIIDSFLDLRFYD